MVIKCLVCQSQLSRHVALCLEGAISCRSFPVNLLFPLVYELIATRGPKCHIITYALLLRLLVEVNLIYKLLGFAPLEAIYHSVGVPKCPTLFAHLVNPPLLLVKIDEPINYNSARFHICAFFMLFFPFSTSSFRRLYSAVSASCPSAVI